MNPPLEAPSPTTAEEATRLENLTTEVSLKSVGYLYFISAAAYVAFAVRDLSPSKGSLVGPVFFIAMAGVAVLVGFGFRKLDRRVVIPGTIFCVLGLAYFPVGTLVNGYVLYLLHSACGKTVFSEAYREVMRVTPHIKYKTPFSTWIVLAALILALVALVGLAAR